MSKLSPFVRALPVAALWAFSFSSSAQTQDSVDRTAAEDAGTIVSAPDLQASPKGQEPRPDFRAEGVSMQNADGLSHRENRAAVNLPLARGPLKRAALEVQQITGRADWVSYEGKKYFGTAELQLSPKLNVLAMGGAAELKLNQFQGRDYDLTNSIPLWRLLSTYTLFKGTDVRVEGSNDFAYVGWRNGADQGQVVEARNLFAQIDSFTISRLELRTSVRESFLVDENLQQSFDHAILYDLAPGASFTLRTGIGAGATGFAFQRPTYWSPTHFENYGLRAIAGKTFASYWNIETQINYGFHHERDHDPEKESSVEGHLSYRDPRGWVLNLNAAFLDVNNGEWWKNDVNLNVQLPF